MLAKIKKEPCKKVVTKNSFGEPNGYLIELFKDGEKTTLYLTSAHPKAFKGYHLHRVRSSYYVCLKGKMKITVYEGPKTVSGEAQKVEHILSADNPERLFLPTNVYIGLENISDEEAWLINFPRPPYDPNLKDEQVDKSSEELEALGRK